MFHDWMYQRAFLMPGNRVSLGPKDPEEPQGEEEVGCKWGRKSGRYFWGKIPLAVKRLGN